MFIFCILGVVTFTSIVGTVALCKAASIADRFEDDMYKKENNY